MSTPYLVEFFPRTRVVVFDPRRYKNDKVTPLSRTMRPATVVSWYGYRSKHCGLYPSVIDVIFDGDAEPSRGHLTGYLKAAHEPPPVEGDQMIEARVAFAPYEPHGWRPEPPTAKSWRFLKEQCNVTGVRLQYLYDDPQWWEDAFGAVIAGGLQVHGNFCANDWTRITPGDVEEATYVWMLDYGHGMVSASALNEVGYSFGPDDIAKGGTRDYMRELVDDFWMPFIRGVRRANPDIIIGGPDAESWQTLQRFVDLVDVDQWLVHPYYEVSDGEGLHFASMAPHGEDLGFMAVRVDGRQRQIIPSEIDNQQLESARLRKRNIIAACLAEGMTQQTAEAYGRSAREHASDEEIDKLTAFSIRMRDEFRAPVVTFGSATFFCTWADVTPWIKPQQQWSTWTHGPEPVMSDAGRRLAAVFAKPAPKIDMRNARRRAL